MHSLVYGYLKTSQFLHLFKAKRYKIDISESSQSSHTTTHS